jgi:hypothetical protein
MPEGISDHSDEPLLEIGPNHDQLVVLTASSINCPPGLNILTLV